MKQELFFITLCLLILCGCSATECGNGVVERGETSETCCADVSCSEGYTCKSLNESSVVKYLCEKKAELKDKTTMYEFKKFKEYVTKIISDYNADEKSVDFELVSSQLRYSDEYLVKLEKDGFDVKIEKKLVDLLERKTTALSLYYETLSKIRSIDASSKESALNEAITSIKNEIPVFSEVDVDTKVALDTSYGFDVNKETEILNLKIKSLDDLKKETVLGKSALIDIEVNALCNITQDPTPLKKGADTFPVARGYIYSSVLKVTNNGAETVNKPAVTVYLYDGSNLIDTFVHNRLFDQKPLSPGETQSQKINEIFSNGGIGWACKSYYLKIEFSSADTNEIFVTKTIPLKFK